jgi:hypothetical protein
VKRQGCNIAHTETVDGAQGMKIDTHYGGKDGSDGWREHQTCVIHGVLLMETMENAVECVRPALTITNVSN